MVLIGTMEQQLKKVQDRRTQRIKAERLRREDNQDNIRKAKLDVGKIQKLTAEVQRLWSELENSYSLGLVTQLENELQDRKEVLLSHYNETKDVVKAHQHQKSLLNEQQVI